MKFHESIEQFSLFSPHHSTGMILFSNFAYVTNLSIFSVIFLNNYNYGSVHETELLKKFSHNKF